MSTTSKPFIGGFGRGAPPNRLPRAVRSLALLTLAASTMLLSGCSSLRNPCGTGLFQNCRLLNGGLFHRNSVVVSDACGEPYLSVPVESPPILGAPRWR